MLLLKAASGNKICTPSPRLEMAAHAHALEQQLKYVNQVS